MKINVYIGCILFNLRGHRCSSTPASVECEYSSAFSHRVDDETRVQLVIEPVLDTNIVS